MRLLRQHQSFETSIVRGRVMVFEGWRFGYGVPWRDEIKTASDGKPNRFRLALDSDVVLNFSITRLKGL